MNSNRLNHAKKRLKGSFVFVPHVWMCHETLYGVSDNEVEEELSRLHPDFLCIVGSTEDEDESDGMFRKVSFVSSLPASHDSEAVLLDNFRVKDWTGVNIRNIEVDISEAWDAGQPYETFHENPIVQMRIDAFIDFLTNYGWVWHVNQTAVKDNKNFQVKNTSAIPRAKSDLQKLAGRPEEKRFKKTELVHRFLKAHPSDSVENFRKMLDFVDALGIGTIGTPKMREMLDQAERQDCKCVWCGCSLTMEFQSRKPNKATWEHMTPRSEGGRNQRWNYLVACSACNSNRGNKQVSEWVSDCMKNKLDVQFHLLLQFFQEDVSEEQMRIPQTSAGD